MKKVITFSSLILISLYWATIVSTTTYAQTLNCPQGQVSEVRGSTVICVNVNQTQNQTANGGLGGNAVVNIEQRSPEVAQLPKTGLPLAAWALTGLTPVGVVLKKFGKNKDLIEQSPNFIWQSREFSKQ